MTYSVRPAKRDNSKPLIGIYAQSGAGKTYTALVLARSYVGPSGRIVMIETEGGRGESYADATEYPEIGGYEVISMRDNFSPENYGEAIKVANQSAPGALIIDSASHEWEGPGGVLDMASENEKAGKKGVLIWQQPKILHQRHFMTPVMATPIPLVIVCMRAKYPMEQRPKKGGSGMEWVRSEHLEPKQSEDVLFEMFVHFWIDMDHNVHVTKSTNKALLDVFPNGKPVTPETGRLLAAWAGKRRETTGQSIGSQSATNGAETALQLRSVAGDVIAAPVRWSDWLTGLEQEFLKCTTPDAAQILWDQNSETFNRGMASAPAGKPQARFNEVGAIALQARTPKELADQF